MRNKKTIIPLAAGILAGAILPTTASAAVDYVKARLSEQPIYCNGEQIECRAYVIEEQNYIRLADLCSALGVESYWDSETRSVYLGKRPAPDGTVTIPVDGSPTVQTSIPEGVTPNQSQRAAFVAVCPRLPFGQGYAQNLIRYSQRKGQCSSEPN